jgi:hypothetical protein
MSDRQIESCLEEFAHGARSRPSLEECLQGKAHLRFWDTNERSTQLLSRLPKVRFTRDDIDAQLGRFLAKELSTRELSDWAGGMRLLGCFVLDEDDPLSSEVWDLMDEMMSPDVWGPLTVESAIDLRRRLNALP